VEDRVNEAIVLAGGLGTRLRGVIGADLPKPLAPVAGRPFLEHVLDHLAQSGVTRVVLSIGYRGEAIRAHFGGAYRDLELRYAPEDEPLGTGGAIQHALAATEAPTVFVVNGDSLLAADLAAAARRFAEVRADVVMCLRAVPDTARYGAVRTAADGRVLGYAEKGAAGPGTINGGLYLVRRDLFAGAGLPRQFSFERDFLERRCDDLRIYGLVTDGYFIDIGIPADYARAQRELTRPRG
jgi:D-glycero-alpha-D-manno-heptose 1-phosphate guanylyltransferase